MAKHLFPSLAIFLGLLAACRTESDPYDILNFGYDILKITDKKDYVFNQIEALWSDVVSEYPMYDSGVINARYALIFLGVLEDSRDECLTRAGRQKLNDRGKSCRQNLIDNTVVIESVLHTISDIGNHMKAIDEMYASVFKNESAPVKSKPHELADRFYESLRKACTYPSTCIFHQMAGNYSATINPGRRISAPSGVGGAVFQAYHLIISHFLKAYAADMYRNEENLNSTRSIQLSKVKFLMHSHAIALIAQSAIKNTVRDIVLREPSQHELSDSPYMELTWYISQIIVNEANLNPTGTCGGQCEDYTQNIVFHKYGGTPSEGKDMCYGTISGCHHQYLGYINPTRSHSRRYEGIKDIRTLSTVPLSTKVHILYGNVRNFVTDNAKNTKDVYYVKSGLFTKCDVCTCLCDDHDNPETIRTFSLRAVTSDITKNMVITGLKLVAVNGTIYIRIRQGRMLNINQVDKAGWPRVDTFDKSAFPMDSFTMGWPSPNTVNMDTISYQQDFVREHIVENHHHHFFFPNTQYVLTGVKFVNQQGSLGFSIRLSAWNAETKTISQRRWNNWIINEKVKHREKISLGSPDIPTKTRDNLEFKGKGYYVQFQPTDNYKDFGQTTVPFLEHRAVVTAPPMPLSGAGLFYKGRRGYGGVIGLKLISVDFSDLIISELHK